LTIFSKTIKIKKIGGHKMGFFDKISEAFSNATGLGAATLKSAYLEKKAPARPGVYKVMYKGKLMKVGKAENGLRKRFSDYYRGTAGGTAGLKYITPENRDDIQVTWKECPKSEARKLETLWHDEAKKRGEQLPWSDRR